MFPNILELYKTIRPPRNLGGPSCTYTGQIKGHTHLGFEIFPEQNGADKKYMYINFDRWIETKIKC